MYIVELESGVWLADWEGDPGRTVVKENAQKFQIERQAIRALKKAREYRPFNYAQIKAV